jgi:hypothetical protein
MACSLMLRSTLYSKLAIGLKFYIIFNKYNMFATWRLDSSQQNQFFSKKVSALFMRQLRLLDNAITRIMLPIYQVAKVEMEERGRMVGILIKCNLLNQL